MRKHLQYQACDSVTQYVTESQDMEIFRKYQTDNSHRRSFQNVNQILVILFHSYFHYIIHISKLPYPYPYFAYFLNKCC